MDAHRRKQAELVMARRQKVARLTARRSAVVSPDVVEIP
jgi:hypothetical protein